MRRFFRKPSVQRGRPRLPMSSPAPAASGSPGQRQQGERQRHSEPDADHPEPALRPGQARLGNAALQRHLVPRLLALLDVLQALRDLVAPAHGRAALGPSIGLLPDQGLLPLVGSGLTGQQRIQEHVGDAPGSGGRQHRRRDSGQVHDEALRAGPAITRPARRTRLPSRRAPRQGCLPRRNSAPAPRISDDRYRSIGAAPTSRPEASSPVMS